MELSIKDVQVTGVQFNHTIISITNNYSDFRDIKSNITFRDMMFKNNNLFIQLGILRYALIAIKGNAA